jgi:hypothetical protein
MPVYLWLSKIVKAYPARGLLDFTLIHYKPLFHFMGFYFDIDGQQGKFFAAFRAFSIIILKNFVRRLKLRAFV